MFSSFLSGEVEAEARPIPRPCSSGWTKRRWWPALLDLLYPPRCVASGCGSPGSWICSSCLNAAAQPPRATLSSFADDACTLAPHLGVVTALGYFEPPLSEAVRALKYRRLAELARPIAERIAANDRPWPPDAFIIPVPAHATRVKERGIDHAGVLAAELADSTGLRTAPLALRRVRHTASQTGLSRNMRRRNLEGAFEACQGLAGCSVVLVDDVLTTGSTALACAEALTSVGVARVDLCVVTIADRFVSGS